MAKETNIFKNLTAAVFTGFDKNVEQEIKKVKNYNFSNPQPLYQTDNKQDFEMAKQQMSQEKYLANQWVRSGYNLSQQTSMVTSNLKLMYRDADLMDGYPMIGAALDLIAEESCLYSDTYIKLLNGETKTVEELFNDNYENFWVYSIDENGVDCKPSKIEKVICNGVKPLLKITLDDGTEIKCTHNHRWLLSDNTWVRADQLKNNDSMMSIYDSINYLGYERVISTNGKKLQLTHRIVAENVNHDEKITLSEKNIPYQKIVIHHKSFNKLNNDPQQLEYMYWDQHQKLHTDLNTIRWENDDFSKKMRKVMSESVLNTWKNKRDILIENFSKAGKLRMSKMTKSERNEYFGRKGENNGMYGTHRTGSLNPNYNHTKNHIEDFNEDDYVNTILKCSVNYKQRLMEVFNTTEEQVALYNRMLIKKYNVKNISEIKYKILEDLSIGRVKKYIRENEFSTKYGSAKALNIKTDQINKILELNGYDNWGDLVKSAHNHRVVKIEEVENGVVYDLVNSSVNNCFGVKCKTGHVISHNCVTNAKGQILNIHSKSPRIKNVLEDLFVNRLDGHIIIPMWVRAMAKYGNCFAMLNITADNGIIGSRLLPVYELERMENGYSSSFINPAAASNDIGTQFIWVGKNEATPFQSWQVAHFRLLTDSTFLPYGVSFLNKGRRHWRMLSMMEDMMLLYRLERGIERRVFKIYVGNIDDADIPAYVNDIANTFKRVPVIDPNTGQLDLRKNTLSIADDIFIPVHDKTESTPIDTLSPASNIDKIEDLKFVQGQLLTALRVPGEFLNYEQSAGNGKNLALKDIRFTRTINRIQQAVIMELNKIAQIHLFLLGFKDDLNNFKITMNSPSSQSEILKLEELSKKITLATDAVRDVGNGMQIMSMTKAQREIMGWTDEEIMDNLMEIRMERSVASELTKTDQIIKRSGIFDKIDKLYGEANAEYVSDGLDGGGDMGGGGGAGGGGGLGGDDTFGEGDMGGEAPPDMGGEGDMGAGGAPPQMGGEQAPAPEVSETPAPDENPMESLKKDLSKLLNEAKTKQKTVYETRQNTFFDSYVNHLKNNRKGLSEDVEITPTFDRTFLLNQETMEMANKLTEYVNPKPVVEPEVEKKASNKDKKTAKKLLRT